MSWGWGTRKEPENWDFAFRRGDVLLTRLNESEVLLLVGNHSFLLSARVKNYDNPVLRIKQEHEE